MKIDKEKIKKFFKIQRAMRVEDEIKPNVTWKYIFFFFVIFNLIQLVAHFYLWRVLEGREIFKSDENLLPLETINRDALDKIIDRFEEKKRDFEKLESAAPSVPDPSL